MPRPVRPYFTMQRPDGSTYRVPANDYNPWQGWGYYEPRYYSSSRWNPLGLTTPGSRN